MTSIKLGDICEETIDCIELLKGEYNSIIEDKLIEGKEKIDEIINEMKFFDNFRVHDPIKGGALRGHINSRKDKKDKKDKLEHWENENKFCELFCREDNLKREVGFSRALFNLKSFNYTDFNTKMLQKIDLLSYESPLIRKKNGKLNTEIGNPFAKCDLIGVGEKLLATIEIKVKPIEKITRLPFALVESLFYGYILKKHADGENNIDLQSEANFCKLEYGRKEIRINENFDVCHFIGAPKTYFKRYIVDKKKEPQKFNKRSIWLSEAENIETATRKLKDIFPKFGGYFLFNQSEKDVVDKGNFHFAVPGFIRWYEPVLHFNSIAEILKACKENMI